MQENNTCLLWECSRLVLPGLEQGSAGLAVPALVSASPAPHSTLGPSGVMKELSTSSSHLWAG